MQKTLETGIRSLGGEDPLEEGMATHSGILARRIPWTEEAGGLQSMGSRRGLKRPSVQGQGSILQEAGQVVEAQ